MKESNWCIKCGRRIRFRKIRILTKDRDTRFEKYVCSIKCRDNLNIQKEKR